jgi:hypothetical protein
MKRNRVAVFKSRGVSIHESYTVDDEMTFIDKRGGGTFKRKGKLRDLGWHNLIALKEKYEKK